MPNACNGNIVSTNHAALGEGGLKLRLVAQIKAFLAETKILFTFYKYTAEKIVSFADLTIVC